MSWVYTFPCAVLFSSKMTYICTNVLLYPRATTADSTNRQEKKERRGKKLEDESKSRQNWRYNLIQLLQHQHQCVCVFDLAGVTWVYFTLPEDCRRVAGAKEAGLRDITGQMFQCHNPQRSSRPQEWKEEEGEKLKYTNKSPNLI